MVHAGDIINPGQPEHQHEGSMSDGACRVRVSRPTFTSSANRTRQIAPFGIESAALEGRGRGLSMLTGSPRARDGEQGGIVGCFLGSSKPALSERLDDA